MWLAVGKARSITGESIKNVPLPFEDKMHLSMGMEPDKRSAGFLVERDFYKSKGLFDRKSQSLIHITDKIKVDVEGDSRRKVSDRP